MDFLDAKISQTYGKSKQLYKFLFFFTESLQNYFTLSNIVQFNFILFRFYCLYEL